MKCFNEITEAIAKSQWASFMKHEQGKFLCKSFANPLQWKLLHLILLDLWMFYIEIRLLVFHDWGPKDFPLHTNVHLLLFLHRELYFFWPFQVPNIVQSLPIIHIQDLEFGTWAKI